MHKSKTHKNRTKLYAHRDSLTHSRMYAHTHTLPLLSHAQQPNQERENKRDVLAHFAQLQRAAKQTHSNCYSSGQWVKLAPTPKHKNQTVCSNWPLPPQARSLSRTLFNLMLSAAVLLFLLRLLLLLMCILWPRAAFAAVCICSCRRRRTLCFCQKIPFIIDYWFSFSPSRCAPSLSPSDSVYVYPTTDHWQLHGTVNVATLARETASPHRCWLWRLRAVQLGGFKPALMRCKLQSMRK